MVFGATTYRVFAEMLASSTEDSQVRDPWVARMRSLPLMVVLNTLVGPLDWPDAAVVERRRRRGRRRLEEESRFRCARTAASLNRALMAAGLVDRVQVTLFPRSPVGPGRDPIFPGAPDFDLELIERRTLDDHIQELIYRPTLR